MRMTAASHAMVLALLPLAAYPLGADDIQSWTDVELRMIESDRVAWTVGGVARIRDSLGSVYDRRAQTDVDVALSDRLTATFGYILRHRVPAGFDFDWNHRLRAGLTYPLLQRGVRVEGTTLYERHVGQPDVPDFNRYRQQIEVERPRSRVSPWLYQSVAFEHRGFMRSRSRMGVRWRLTAGHALRGAYQYESIKEGATWRPRHAIYSEWSLDLTARRRAGGAAPAGYSERDGGAHALADARTADQPLRLAAGRHRQPAQGGRQALRGTLRRDEQAVRPGQP